MMKNISRYEVVVNGKTGHFYFENDTPLPEAKEMLFQCLKFLGQIEDKVRSKIEEQESSASEPKTESIG